jgi:hypothetical protein
MAANFNLLRIGDVTPLALLLDVVKREACQAERERVDHFAELAAKWIKRNPENKVSPASAARAAWAILLPEMFRAVDDCIAMKD